MSKWPYPMMVSAAIAALALSSCGDNSDKKINERSAELGFISQLPLDTAYVVGCYDIPTLWGKLKGSALARILYNMNEGEDDLLKAIPVTSQELMTLPAIGSEVILAQTGDVGAQITTLTSAIQQIQALSLSELTKGTKTDDTKIQDELNKILAVDITPTIIALKNNDAIYLVLKEGLAKYVEQAKTEKNIAIESYSQTIGKETFEGYKIKLTELVKSLNEGKIPPELSSLPEDKYLYLLMNRFAGNTVFILGTKMDNFSFAETPAKGIVGTEGFNFMDNYIGKKPAFVTYLNKSTETAIYNYYSSSLKTQETAVTTILLQKAKDIDTDPSKAIASFQNLMTAYGDYLKFTMGDINGTGTFGWWDKGLVFNIHTNCYKNVLNGQATLAYSSLREDPSMLIYSESQITDQAKGKIIDLFDKFGTCIIDTGDAFAVAKKLPKGIDNYKALYEKSRPYLVKIGQGIHTLSAEGLKTDTVLVITKANGNQMINIVGLSDVLNATKIKEGWAAICEGGNSIGEMNLGPMWSMFTPQATTATADIGGQSFTCSEVMPGPGLSASIGLDSSTSQSSFTVASALNEKTLAFGFNGAGVKSTVEAALKSATTPLKGMSFKINMTEIYALASKVDPEFAPFTTPLSEDIKSIESNTIDINGETAIQVFLKTE